MEKGEFEWNSMGIQIPIWGKTQFELGLFWISKIIFNFAQQLEKFQK